jgi:bacteriocin biosynthesis cyclodehydratase domain-containing protein
VPVEQVAPRPYRDPAVGFDTSLGLLLNRQRCGKVARRRGPHGTIVRMVLRIDPRYPLVWRSPSSLQLGVADPVVVLHEVSGADELMLSALLAGVSRPGLAMIARGAGSSDEAATALLAALAPALEPTGPSRVHSVTLVGFGRTADRIAAALAGEGVRVYLAHDSEAAAATACDLAIAVGHYVLAPELHGLWLRRDVAHLPVVLSDTSTTVGPMVEPGVGPCLYCLQRYRTDADAAWPAVSAQLWGRRSPIESHLVAGEIAGVASRAALTRLNAGHAASAHSSVEISVLSGQATTRAWHPHPECGCTGVSVAVRRETGSSVAVRGGSRRSSSPSPPRSDSAFAEPA